MNFDDIFTKEAIQLAINSTPTKYAITIDDISGTTTNTLPKIKKKYILP